MELRGETATHAYKGETKGRGWGKYISKDLNVELTREWKPPKQNHTDDPEKARQIKQQIEVRRQQILARREKEAAAKQKAEALEKKALLPEIERDREIRKVIESLTISDRDFRELTKRGFTPDQIYEYDYKSIQVEQPLEQKVSHLLAGVKADGQNLNNKVSGMILPIPNEKGLYTGWQYKLNHNKNKYLWPKTYVSTRPYNITSKLKNSLELPIGYFRPKSRSPKTDHIALTESVGFKPRLTADRFNLLTIGASGGMFTSSPKTFEKLLKTAKQELNTNKVVIYGDAGAVKNPLVLNRYHHAAEFLRERGFEVSFAWWEQIDKQKHSDIDEILTDTKIDLISPEEFFAMGKQYCNWKPTDSPSIADPVNFSSEAIADEFTSDLRNANDSDQLDSILKRYQTKFSDRFEQIKTQAWNNLSIPTKKKITELISNRKQEESIQQQRVEAVVPLLASYLNSHRTHKVESDKSIVEYNKAEETISYSDKIDKKEYLRAKRIEGVRWMDVGSNISEEKMKYFTQEVAPKIEKLAQKTKEKAQAKSLQR